MRTCMPSPGPMWATWLKLVGLEISLDLISGSLSISLLKKTETTSHGLGAAQECSSVRDLLLKPPDLLCCSRSSSGTLKRNFLLLRVLTISFLLLSEVSGMARSQPSVETRVWMRLRKMVVAQTMAVLGFWALKPLCLSVLWNLLAAGLEEVWQMRSFQFTKQKHLYQEGNLPKWAGSEL